jgi:integrase
MATFNYKLQGNNIKLHFNYGRSKVLRISTGYKVNDVSSWKDQKIRSVKAEPNANKYNKRLSALREHFIEKYDNLIAEGEPIDKTVLKEVFNSFDFTPATTLKKKAFDIDSLLDEWILYCMNEHRTRSGKKLKEATLRTYKNGIVVFKEYIKINKITSPKKIDKACYHKMLTFMENRDYALNYSGQEIKIFKSFFKYLKNDKKIELPNYDSNQWKALQEDSDEIYLTNGELMQMYYLDLSHLKNAYSRARDLFLISAFTGLRISDNKLLEDKHIIEMDGYKFFKVHSKKTDTETFIPISPIVNQILERNNGLPKRMGDQTVNYLIKEIGEFCGFDESVKIRKTKGGKVVEKLFMKFDLIKTHTARRSFCTNAYLGGMDALSIMAVSGHKTEKNFQTYIKVTKKQQALRNAKSEYFLSLNAERFKKDGTNKLKIAN